MTEPMHEAPPKQRRLDTVTVERPRCPACGGIKLRKYRSITDQGDGSALCYVRCMDERCGYRIRMLQEGRYARGGSGFQWEENPRDAVNVI